MIFRTNHPSPLAACTMRPGTDLTASTAGSTHQASAWCTPGNSTTPALEAENERLADELISVSRQLDTASAERDRLASLLVIERAIFESQLAAAEGAEKELAALKQTKILRYTSTFRRTYGTIRSLWQKLQGRR